MSASPPLSVSVTVHMHSPTFVPGSHVRATITLHAEQTSLHASLSSIHPTPQRPLITTSASATSTLATFPPDATAIADYVVCELSGRWSSDRSWVVSDAHPKASAKHLDNHAHPPLASASTPRVVRVKGDPNIGPYPWSGALADANAIGGGGRAGHSGIIFRSQPLVVCEREQIPAGSQVCFEVDVVLPDEVPPTLRGSAMRYTYALLVVVNFPDADAPRVVRVPFRVVSAGGTKDDMARATRVIQVPTMRGVGPFGNRFLHEKDVTALSMSAKLLKSAPPDDIEIALALSLNGRLTPYKSDADNRTLEALDELALTSLKDLSFISTPKGWAGENEKNVISMYSITRGRFSIAKFYLTKRAHHLGDTVSAVFHFQGDKPCYRLGARLEAQEVIQPDFSIGQKSGTGEDPNMRGVIFRRVYGEHGEFVMSNRNTHVTFSIPHDAPPSFATKAVAVRWLIHFVFLTPRTAMENDLQNGREGEAEVEPLLDALEISANGGADGDIGWEGGPWKGEDPKNWTHLPQKNVDVLRWTLPIVVSGQPGSQWGTRSTGRLMYRASGS